MTKPYNERDIENQLVDHITRFLLELGRGFSFVGRQYHLEVGETDYYLDLLFYHIKLKCYVVIELKNTKFIPEYAGKLNFLKEHGWIRRIGSAKGGHWEIIDKGKQDLI